MGLNDTLLKRVQLIRHSKGHLLIVKSFLRSFLIFSCSFVFKAAQAAVPDCKKAISEPEVHLKVKARVDIDPEILRVNKVLADDSFQEKFRARLEEAQTNNPKMSAQGKVASINFRIELLNQIWSEEGNTQNLILLNDDTIRISQDGSGKDLQSVPLRKMMLPYISTGAYIPQAGIYQPKAKVAEATPDSILIMLPGVGSTKSHALSLLPVLSRFSKATDSSIAEIKVENSHKRKARTLAIGLDSTGQGLASGPAALFNSPEYSIEMIRHNVLIMKLLFPDAPVFIGGRSQGGLQALEYGSYYNEVAGIFALNPTSIDPLLHTHTINIHEGVPLSASFGMGEIELDPAAWGAFKDETLNFSYTSREPLVPVHYLVGKSDPSYAPDPKDLESESSKNIQGLNERNMNAFQSAHPQQVKIASWDEGTHDMWSPIMQPRVFDDVVRYMSQAMHASGNGEEPR